MVPHYTYIVLYKFICTVCTAVYTYVLYTHTYSIHTHYIRTFVHTCILAVLEKAMELSHSSWLICKYIGVQKELARQGLKEEGSIEEGVVKMLSSSEERGTTRASSAAIILEVCMYVPTVYLCVYVIQWDLSIKDTLGH